MKLYGDRYSPTMILIFHSYVPDHLLYRQIFTIIIIRRPLDRRRRINMPSFTIDRQSGSGRGAEKIQINRKIDLAVVLFCPS